MSDYTAMKDFMSELPKYLIRVSLLVLIFVVRYHQLFIETFQRMYDANTA